MSDPAELDPNEIIVVSEPLPREALVRGLSGDLSVTAADQHRSLTPEYWARYSRAQQVLMIANEMNRASKLFAPASRAALLGCYTRILVLADLTAAMPHPRGFRREMLRFRELVGAQFVSAEPDQETHGRLFYALLAFTPESYRQVAHVTGLPSRGLPGAH